MPETAPDGQRISFLTSRVSGLSSPNKVGPAFILEHTKPIFISPLKLSFTDYISIIEMMIVAPNSLVRHDEGAQGEEGFS